MPMGRMPMKKIVDVSDKPYFKCLSCPNFPENKCNIPFSRMPLLDWCICMRAGKEANHLTNAYVAEKSDTSIKRIEQIFALNCDQDIRRDTARRVEITIFGESTEFVRCPEMESAVPEASEQLQAAMMDLERELDEKYHAALDNLRNSHAAEMLAIKTANEAEKDAIKAEYDAKIHYLKNQLERSDREKDIMWNEITRKSRIIDGLVEKLEKD